MSAINTRSTVDMIMFAGPSCSDPGTPAEAVQHANTYQEGELVTYTCSRTGFGPEPAYPLQCIVENGNLTWNGSLPNCVGKCLFTTQSSL